MKCTTHKCNNTAMPDSHICAACLVTGGAIKTSALNIKATLPEGSIESTLAERGNRYGSFEDHAVISQQIQDVMRSAHDGKGWARLASDQKQALSTIADKIARMLNGDPNYRDNWHDIVGYAKLVDDRMKRDEEAKK